MPVDFSRDPRRVLARQKYFGLRPQPLEQWLWKQGTPPSAERVFWLHWQEGMINGDWCSAIPLRRVAQLCCLDISTVTRAYQALAGAGLIRRTDPGRDPANPFQQATAITEVRIPRGLVLELDRHPNRPAGGEPRAAAPTPTPTQVLVEAPAPGPAPEPARINAFAGLSLKQLLRVRADLGAAMSPSERRLFEDSQRLHRTDMVFDPTTRLRPEQQAQVLQWLDRCAVTPASEPGPPPSQPPAPPTGPRRLSVFELATLRRGLQGSVEPGALAERLREIAWSIEEGALRRFHSQHAIRIALKKVREGAWSRPHRLPPNWAKAWPQAALTETCRSA